MARGAFPPIERGPYRSLEVKLLADGVDNAATISQASSLFHPALLRARSWHLLAIVCCFFVVQEANLLSAGGVLVMDHKTPDSLDLHVPLGIESRHLAIARLAAVALWLVLAFGLYLTATYLI
jgi:hypothetical protein